MLFDDLLPELVAVRVNTRDEVVQLKGVRDRHFLLVAQLAIVNGCVWRPETRILRISIMKDASK